MVLSTVHIILPMISNMHKIEFPDETSAEQATAHLQNSGVSTRQVGKAVLVGVVHSTLLAEVMVKYRGYTIDPSPCDSLG